MNLAALAAAAGVVGTDLKREAPAGYFVEALRLGTFIWAGTE